MMLESPMNNYCGHVECACISSSLRLWVINYIKLLHPI